MSQFLSGYFSDRQLESNLNLKRRQLDLSDKDAELKKRKLESDQAQKELEKQGLYTRSYMKQKNLKLQKAYYPLLVKHAKKQGYFGDLNEKWSPEMHKKIVFMHDILPQDIERAKLDFDKQYKMEKLDLEKEQFELKRQESSMPKPSKNVVKETSTGFQVIDTKTGIARPVMSDIDSQPILTSKQAEKLKETKIAQDYDDVNIKDFTANQDNTYKIIEDLKKEAKGSVGLANVIQRRIQGTSEYDFTKLVDTLKANIGFDKLQDMRDKSPTGGALGQVSERELSFLQATLGSLDVGQSPKAFLSNLQRIEKRYKQIMESAKDRYIKKYGQKRYNEIIDKKTIKFLGFE